MAFLPGRMRLITLLEVCLKVFRVLGFLPYSWDASGRCPQTNKPQTPEIAWSSSSLINVGGDERELSSPAFPCCFKRRQSLVTLSWIFVFIRIAHGFAVITVHAYFLKLDINDLGNLVTTHNITDLCIHLFSVLLSASLMTVLLLRGDRLAHLLQSLSNIIASHHVVVLSKVDVSVCFVFLLYLLLALVSTVVELQHVEETETHVVKKQLRYVEDTSFCIVHVLLAFTVMVLILFFRAVAVTLSENYTNILREKLPRETHSDLTKVRPEDCDEEEIEAWKLGPEGERKTDGGARERKVNYSKQDLISGDPHNGRAANSGGGRKIYALQDLSSADPYSRMVTSGDSRKETAPSLSPLTITDITTAIDQLQDLHQFQHLLNAYFGLPLSLSLVKMILVVVIQAFFAANVADRWRLACIFVAIPLDLSLMVHLFSAPESVTLQREKLREAVLLRRLKETSNMELVDKLASFMATYLVILLQFNQGDKGSSGKEKNNPVQ